MTYALPNDFAVDADAASANSAPIAINSSTTPNRLDDLPLELRNLLVNFTALEMRAVIAHLPQFRIRSDDEQRGRRRLCEWAAEHGYLDLLKWAHPRDFPLLLLADGKGACAAAARGGHLAVLQWLREIRCRWDATTTSAAAGSGDLEVLQWAHEHGCPWDTSTTTEAAEGGHLVVLQWLRVNDCEWDEYVTLAAAQKGHLEVLEWALANGCPLHPSAGFVGIYFSGDLRIVQWALQRPLVVPCDYESAPGLTLEVLCYLKEQWPNLPEMWWPPLKILATRQLARVGDLAGLQWARENGYFEPDEVCWGASRGGQLEVLKWVRENGFPFKLSYPILAQGGHLECLKWAVANGERPTASICADTAQYGHVNVLQWLRNEMRCEWNSDILIKALMGGHMEVIEWAQKHGCPVIERVFEEAARFGFADVLLWAFKFGGTRIRADSAWCKIAAILKC